MKSTPLWIGMTSLLLVACDKEQPAASEAPARPSLAERREAMRKEAAARPPAEVPAEEILPPPVAAPPPVEPQAPVAEAPPAAPRSTPSAPTGDEREAQRAEERAQRVAQMTEQINTRMMERDANGDGLLSKDEVAGPMQRGFERMDTNGDGSLDGAEREAMVTDITERMSEFSRNLRNRGFGEGGGRRPDGPGGNNRRRD